MPGTAFNLTEFCPSASRPLRILFSGCLLGVACGTDGSSYGTHELPQKISAQANVVPVWFCPEDHAFGTPREYFSIYGGDGFDVLDGHARVLTTTGKDWTAPAIKSAEALLAFAEKNDVELAIMMDISPSCGSRVIYLDDPSRKQYQQGAGVAAALLLRHGYTIFTQRDWRYLEILLAKLDPTFSPNSESLNHFEDTWYRDYFLGK